MASPSRPTRITVAGLIGLLGLLAGLCTAFILVVTVGVAWREHAQESWPEVPATIERCSVDLRYFNGPADPDPTWWIECRIGFRTETDQIKTTIHSGHRSNPSQGYPELMNQWVNDHPSGSQIVIRYAPDDHKTVILSRDYMPNGEPKTRYNLKFLIACFISCICLLIIAKLFRDRAKSRSFQA
jgi:Protein of unknown function (DUF3592)